MASNDEDLCTSHADFAVICSFIDKFGEKLGLTLPNIGELQNYFEDTDNVNPLLSQGVCLLLRRINKSVKFDRWERGLQRFAHTYSHQDGWELERFGFKKAKLEVKIRVFKNLLERQFDLYKSFKDKVNLLGASELRLQPCGRDKKGVSYWCQLDDCANLRIYSDDQDEETWTLVASTREELVALLAELDSESPPGASREMSIDGSRSGTVTPMGLSEAPTPVDSKAATPVASGRTSPVTDLGQAKDDSIKIEEKKIKGEIVVEKIKERLKAEETKEVLKNSEKSDGTAAKVKDENENKQPSRLSGNKEESNRLSENKEENLKDTKGIAEAVDTKLDAAREKELDLRPGTLVVEQKRQESSGPPGIDSRPEEKPLLPVNKDTVMRERDKKPFELNERNESKRKETVWDKLSKQKEERAEGLLAEKGGKEILKGLAGHEKLWEGKANLKVSKFPPESQKEAATRPMELGSDERKTDSKVSDVGRHGPRQDKLPLRPEFQSAKESSIAEQSAGPDKTLPVHKTVLQKPWKSPFPASIGSVSITPVQPAKDRTSGPAGSENFLRNLPSSTTITPSTRQVPVSSPTGPLSPTSKMGPLSPTSKAGPLSPTSKAGPLSPTSKAGPLSPISKSGSLSMIPISSKSGSFSSSFKGDPLSQTSVPLAKSGPLSPTLLPYGKSGPLSPTSIPPFKTGPLSPTSVPFGKSGLLSPTSVPLSKSGPLSSTVITHSKGGPLSPTSVMSGRLGALLSQSSVSVDKGISSVQSSASSKGMLHSSYAEAENASHDPHNVPAVKSLVDTGSVASNKSLTASQSTISAAAVSSPSVVSSSHEMATSNITLSSLSSDKAVVSSPEASLAKTPQICHSAADIIPPFPPVPTKGTQPATPKDVPPSTTSVLTLKRVPRVSPASTPEAIPPTSARAPPLSMPHHIPAETETSLPPFPPAPGRFPTVPELTARDVPRASVVPVSKDKPMKYFRPPSLMASNSTSIPTPPTEGPLSSKAPPFEQMAPGLPVDSTASIAPFPQVPSTFPKVPVANKDTPSSSVNSACGTKSSSTYFATPPKFTSSTTIPTPTTRAPSISKDVNTPSSTVPTLSIRVPSITKDGNTVEPPPKKTKVEDEPLPIKAKVEDEPPQKRAKVEDVQSESQKESPKGPQVGSGRVLNLLKRPLISSLEEKKEVGGPHEAKVMRKEGVSAGNAEELKQRKPEETPETSGKVPLLNKSTLLQTKEDPSSKAGLLNTAGISAEKTQSTELIPSTEVRKPTVEPARRILKLHNFGRESSVVKPVASEPVEKKDGSGTSSKEPDVGEAIEEPVMIVKGEGEGAKCESGNDLHYLDNDCSRSHSSKPWWECFDSVSNSRNVVTYEDSSETIEEHVMYFWGDGNGVDCDAGNNGDETETNAETKQGDSGSSALVAADSKGNSTTGEVKPQKEKESGKADSDLKEVDGVTDSDDAKVNGLRTLESVDKTEKSLNQLEKTETKGDGKHSGVNGKESKEDNDVCGEKTSVNNKNGKLGEGKSKKDKPLEKEKCENVVNDKDLSDKEEPKVKKQDSSRDKEDKSTVGLDGSKKPRSESEEVKESSRETCAKRGTRNRASLEEVKDVSEEESEKDDYDDDDDDDAPVKESRSVKKKRGRPKGSTMAARGRKPRQARAGSQRVSDVEEDDEIDNEDEDDEDDDDEDNPDGTKSRKRGKGSSGRPLPDAPRQRSARIAKIREKEEEDRRSLEAVRMKQLAEENRLRELKRKAREERRALREIKKGRREKKEKKKSLGVFFNPDNLVGGTSANLDKEKKKKKRKKKAKKKPNTTGDPWDNSSSSSSSSSEEDEIEEEEEDNLEFKSDHEFSPESDIEDADAQPIKRARTAKKVVVKSDVEDAVEEEEEEESEEDQTQCTKCGHDDHPETILLCDNCDAGWHLSCLRPPLLSVPEGDWICPTCEHVVLIKKLREVLERFDECQKKAQNEELRRQRIAYVNVSLDNILPEGGKKKKKKRIREDGEEEDDSGSDSDSDDSDSESDDSSGSSSESSTESEAPLYTLRARSARTLKEQVEDFDEMINEAIRDEMEAAAGAGNAGRGKDIDNIIQADEGEEEEEEVVGEGEEAEVKAEPKQEVVENKENEKPSVEVPPSEEEPKEEKKEESEEVKREREVDEDDEDVAPKRKKQKPAASEHGSENDDDEYRDSDDHNDSESDDEEEVKTVRKRIKPYNMYSKKRRRLTDLDAEDDDDASDEDFMNSSEDEDDESDESAASSSSMATEYDSDDSDVVGGKRRRGSRSDNLPLRRSTRNRRSGNYDEDSDEEKSIKRSKKKKKRRRSSSEEEESSDSERSYNKRKKKVNPRKKLMARSKGRRGSKKGRGKKQGKSKPKAKKPVGEDGEKPVKPRIKYSKPPKSKEEQEEEVVAQKRVTRGRQVNYYDALLMTDESSEEEPQKKGRGKVMKGERVPTESSEYEASEDELMKRRGFSGSLGRGKVMKGEEEDEEEDNASKKKRGRPKKPEDDDELIGKPSPPRPSTIKATPVMQVTSVSPAPKPFMQATSVSPTPPPVKPATSIIPIPARLKPTDLSTTPSASRASAAPAPAPPVAIPPAAAYVPAAASPVHRTPEPAVSPSPGAPVPTPVTKVLSSSIAAVSNLGNNSPGHQQPPLGKWSPHLSGVTITNVSASSAPGTPPRPNIGSAPGSGTPPRPGLSGPPVTASPPPPYRSSPLPLGRGATPSSAAPVGPPNTSSPHPAAYPPYGRPPPEHYSPHPGKERFPSHPAFPEYAPPGRHSPSPHGVPSRHPSHIPSGHSLPHMPAGYGPPGPGSYPPGGVPPHPGVLRGPPHDLYRPPHSTHPSHGSPNHPGHPHLVMKPGYPGLEPLPYSGSPGPSPGPIGIHPGSQGSPAQQSPNEDSKEGALPTSKGPGEFSSGLMSYFSSQRDDDVE